MVKKITSTKKGFSLVEVVAALAIMAILFVGVTQLIATSKKVENNTNEKITNASVLNSTSNILFSLDNKGIDLLLNKTIRFAVTGPGDVSEMILSELKKPEANLSNLEGDYNKSFYTNNSSKENPIKFLVYVNVEKLKEDPNNKNNILYKANINVISLDKNEEYYYNNGQKEGRGENINIGLNTENITKDTDDIILRPMN